MRQTEKKKVAIATRNRFSVKLFTVQGVNNECPLHIAGCKLPTALTAYKHFIDLMGLLHKVQECEDFCPCSVFLRTKVFV